MQDHSNPLFDQVANAQEIDPAEPENAVIGDMLSTGMLIGIIAGFLTFLLYPDTLIVPGLATLIGMAVGALLGWDKPEAAGSRVEKRRAHSRTHLTL